MNLTMVAGVVMFTFEVGRELWRAHKEHKEKRQAEAAEEPLLFLPAQVEQFTHADGQARAFDHDVARVIHQDLAQRSVAPQEVSPAVGAIAQAYRLVPPSPELPIAADVVAQAQADGQVVLGSLSCAFLACGLESPDILLVGREAVLELAPLRDERGQPAAFAVLPRARAPEPAAAATHASEPEFEPELAHTEPPAPALMNGKAQHAPASLAELVGAREGETA